MGDRGARRLLRGMFALLGTAATVTGTFTVLTGSGGVVGGGEAGPSVESELRFFAAFWVGFGLASLWVSRRAEREPRAVRALALLLFFAGLARAVAWAAAGRPHTLFIVLLALELAFGPIALLAQRRLDRAG